MIKQYKPRKKHERFKVFLNKGRLEGRSHIANPFELIKINKDGNITARSERIGDDFYFVAMGNEWRYEHV